MDVLSSIPRRFLATVVPAFDSDLQQVRAELRETRASISAAVPSSSSSSAASAAAAAAAAASSSSSTYTSLSIFGLSDGGGFDPEALKRREAFLMSQESRLSYKRAHFSELLHESRRVMDQQARMHQVIRSGCAPIEQVRHVGSTVVARCCLTHWRRKSFFLCADEQLFLIPTHTYTHFADGHSVAVDM